jgi:hypothetical protein
LGITEANDYEGLYLNAPFVYPATYTPPRRYADPFYRHSISSHRPEWAHTPRRGDPDPLHA